MAFFDTYLPRRGRTASTTALDVEQLYLDHAAGLWRASRALGVEEAAVDDLVQEVFVVAVRRQAEFEQRSKVETWLMGILINQVRNHRRKNRWPKVAVSETLVDPAANPSKELEREQLRAHLTTLLNGLPDEQREVWILCEMESMSAREVAEVLEISPNTVSSRLRLARNALRVAAERHRRREGGAT